MYQIGVAFQEVGESFNTTPTLIGRMRCFTCGTTRGHKIKPQSLHAQPLVARSTSCVPYHHKPLVPDIELFSLHVTVCAFLSTNCPSKIPIPRQKLDLTRLASYTNGLKRDFSQEQQR